MMTNFFVYIRNFFDIIETFLLKNTFKEALTYLFNVFILFNTVFTLNLILN